MNSNSLNKRKTSVFADIKAGFIISLIALPLCLGIATASGFPPIAGLITAIVGGCIVSWIGSASFTIKGPAAGLIVIALGAVTELGQGDMAAGYQKALAVGVGAGFVQLCFAYLRTAGLGIAMSKTVVHGMLAAIGVIIIAKQIHVGLGVVPEAHESFGLIHEIPHSLMNANFAISMIGFVSLLILLLWKHVPFRILKAIPAQLIVLFVAVPIALYLGLSSEGSVTLLGFTSETGGSYLVNLPASILDGIVFPDFSAFFTLVSLKYILMFSLVGTIESTLSVVAVDAINDYKSPSNLNKDLFAVSVGNIISAFLGGLPMISEIVRSKANVDAGAQSYRANFFHGCFLLLYVVALAGVIELIPLSALAAMLVITGLRLASVKELLHAKQVGTDQLLLFVVTILVTLMTDLLIGVAVGLCLKIALHALRGVGPVALFTNSVSVIKRDKDWLLKIEGNATFPCLLKLRKSLDQITEEKAKVVVDVSHAKVVDHTFLSGLEVAFCEHPNIEKELCGLENLTALGSHPCSVHVKRKK